MQEFHRVGLVVCLVSLSLPAAALELDGTAGERDRAEWEAHRSRASGALVRVLDPGRPVRARRKWAIAGEAAYNGLAGLGVNATYHVSWRLALDLGAGLSTVGLKGGARARFNLLESSWTPFLGTGFLMGSGTGGDEVEIEKSRSEKARIRILPSPYLQAVAGVNYTDDGGFMFMATAGYAVLLRKNNVELVSGSQSVFDFMRRLNGSGIVLGASIGYAF